MTMAWSGVAPICAQTSCTVRALTSALTISPTTLPVSLPSRISSVLARVKSSFRRGLSWSVKWTKPPDTSSVLMPSAWTACSMRSAPGDRRRRSA
ncbi:hypothetical protein D9M72_358290 [compost metagenome]